jgi:hypothetical protein
MDNQQDGFDSDVLDQVTASDPIFVDTVICVTICHNEVRIIRQFLDHYRGLGCEQFLIVDDNSDDGTAEYLKKQADVTLFQPANGARFSENVGIWRQQILDHFCVDRWVTLPDVDEFLYHKMMPNKLTDVAKELEVHGEEALLAVMIDMYGGGPISAQTYTGERPLEEEFPCFDGQGVPPAGIRIVAQPSSFLKRYPTPQVCFMGGVRERLFFQNRLLTAVQRWLLSKFAHLRRPLNPNALHRFQNSFVRAATKACFSETPFVLNKFALLKWRLGTQFSRAPHSINRSVRVSEGLAVFLHYKFYKGQTGLVYSLDRGQHAGGSVLYKKMLKEEEVFKMFPTNANTRRFDGLISLGDILR